MKIKTQIETKPVEIIAKKRFPTENHNVEIIFNCHFENETDNESMLRDDTEIFIETIKNFSFLDIERDENVFVSEVNADVKYSEDGYEYDISIEFSNNENVYLFAEVETGGSYTIITSFKLEIERDIVLNTRREFEKYEDEFWENSVEWMLNRYVEHKNKNLDLTYCQIDYDTIEII